VDPIADKFPHVSTFNYAENRPISGIDLWGLQYVDANSSFYQIATGQVWVKTNSFQSGRDAFGQNYIGTAVPLSRFGLTRSDGSSFPAIRGGANDLRNIGNNLGRMFEASGTTSLGNLDNSARAYQKASNQAVGLGKVGLSLVALDLAKGVYTSINGYLEVVESDKQEDLIDDAFADVLKALNSGQIDEQFHNLQDISVITNFVYQGEDSFGDNEQLRNTAIYISKNISGNYKGDDEYIRPDSGLDNFKPSPIIVSPPTGKPDDNN